MHTFIFSSAIGRSPEAFWSSMIMASVNAELSPWVRMSSPRDWRQRPIARWATDRALFRSVIFLFGMLPVDGHSFRLERVHPERSIPRMLPFVGNQGVAALLVPVYRWVFHHRHRRLGALYGHEHGGTSR